MIQRQQNWLGQQRVDVAHLRALESSAAADMDLLAGSVLAGGQSQVVKGLAVAGAVGAQAETLAVVVADSVILHSQSAEPGTLYSVPAGAAAEVLVGTNANTVGAFVSGQTNYVGLELYRIADPDTSDLVMFLASGTGLETGKTVPLARVLAYRLHITTTDFSMVPTLMPLARVQVDAVGAVTSISDCRPLLFRLGSGGTYPDTKHYWPWAGGRDEAVNVTAGDYFGGGDKTLTSLKDNLDALMTRVWELGGGSYWYSPTSARDVRVVNAPPGPNWTWNLALQQLSWTGGSVVFANSAAAVNEIVDGVAVALADGYCVYVDLNRDTDKTGANALTAQVGARSSLGQGDPPGSRQVLAWRVGASVYVYGYPYEVGRAQDLASDLAFGSVKLTVAAGHPLNPSVIPIDANGRLYHSIAYDGGETVYAINTAAGVGVNTVGVYGSASAATHGKGVCGLGHYGVYGEAINGGGGYGVFGLGYTETGGNHDGGNAVYGRGGDLVGGGTKDGIGVSGDGGGSTNGVGVAGTGSGAGTGVVGAGGPTGFGAEFIGNGTRAPLHLVAQASVPSDATEGQLYYNSTDHKLYVRTNIAWIVVGTQT